MSARPEQFQIKRAERKQARLRLAVCAASNGGKTWTSIELGFGLVEELLARGVLAGTLEGKVGVVDTERKSAQLYAHLGPYDTIELDPPYSVDRYVAAMTQFERAGYAVIILDSISHAWMGQGGVLALLDAFEDRQRFSAFGTTVNPKQDEFVDAMLRSPCHVIATMRSKTAWVLEQKDRGGRTVNVPKRVGMAPIQRPGIEYEFTTLLDLDTDSHVARVVKNRCPVFNDWSPRVITREHGRQLAAWLLEGAPVPAEPLSGTPLERAEATLAAAFRNMHRCENAPDLARVFGDADKALRGFAPGVPIEEIARLRAKLANEKDLCKSSLGRPENAGPVVDVDMAVHLEAIIQDAGVPLERALEHLKVPRLAMLPRARLQEAIDWVAGEALENNLPAPALTRAMLDLGLVVPALARPAGKFDDMKDDLPWRD